MTPSYRIALWCVRGGLRGTLHLLAVEDLDWLLPLLGPHFIAGDRRRRAELGLDEETCTRGVQLIRHLLASQGSLTRDTCRADRLLASGSLVKHVPTCEPSSP